MIYVTGDTHGTIDYGKLGMRKFLDQKYLSKGDYLIICGDWGGVWYGTYKDNYLIDWYNDKPFTTLFVDGNHENHVAIAKYPEKYFFGGKVNVIADSVYHLKRGEIYSIQDHNFFTMGGAVSTDKEYRTEGKSWWPEELPTDTEIKYAKQNIADHDYNIDYIITHAAPTKIQSLISNYDKPNRLTNFFSWIDNTVDYSHWYFGHYHKDIRLDERHTCLYNMIERIV